MHALRSRLCAAALALGAALPCAAAAPSAPPAPQQAASGAQLAGTAPLALRASELFERAEVGRAAALLRAELPQRLAAFGSAPDALAAADLAVAARLWAALARQQECWAADLAALGALAPSLAQAPAELVGRLGLLRAELLRAHGEVEAAREQTRALGVLSDWQLIGPFANERGGGYERAFGPESSIELDAPLHGLEREVRWRAFPCADEPLGRVQLHELLRPATQACAFLATTVVSERERDVCAWISSSCAYRLYVDGVERAARKLVRPFELDQDRVPLRLAAGENRLVLKLATEEQPQWVAQVRLCGPDGRALGDLRVDSAAIARAPAPAPQAAPAPLAPDCAETLEALAFGAGAPARQLAAAKLLALEHLLAQREDAHSKPARRALARALELAPEDVQALYLSARAEEPLPGQSLEELELNTRLHALFAVLARDPEHTGALCDLADLALAENPNPERADELSARALAAAPESWRALHVRVDFLESRGRDEEARALRLRGLALPEAECLSLAAARRAEVARRRGERAAALAELERAFASNRKRSEVLEQLVAAEVDRGDASAALATLDSYLAGAPDDVDAWLQTARLSEGSGDLPAAHERLQRALALAPERADLHAALARLYEREGQRAQTEAELAEVARLEPGNTRARRARSLVASAALERFEGPWRWDGIERALAAADQAAPPGNEPFSVIDRTRVWKVEADGAEQLYEHILLRVHNDGGVRALDRYPLAVGADETLLVEQLRVIHADGRSERAPAPRGASQRRLYDLPTLAPGDFVDVEYRVEQQQPDVFGKYFGARHEFYLEAPDPLAPVLRSELVVLSPPELPIYTAERNTAGIEHEIGVDPHGWRLMRWVARDLRRPQLQTAMPDPSEFAPIVDLSTYVDWQHFARWWWDFIESQLDSSPALEAKVSELCAGLGDERERIGAIQRFVSQEVRYNAWPFGTHGYEPYSATTIFERRFGDCKDKSILMRQMLAVIGVRSTPALLRAGRRRAREPLELAMVEHFDHCILWVEPSEARAGFFLDATADLNPLEYLREDDQGARALVVRPDGCELTDIPYAAPAENRRERRYELALDAQGGARVKLSDESKGAFGVDLRNAFGGEPGDLAARAGVRLREAFGKVEVARATTSRLEDLRAPAEVEFEFDASGLWSSDARGFALPLGFDSIGLLQPSFEPPAERRYDVVLDRPFELDSDVLYQLPPGFAVLELPPHSAFALPGLLEYELEAREQPGGVRVRRRFELAAQRVPLARYEEFLGALRAIRQIEERRVLLSPQGSGAEGRR